MKIIGISGVARVGKDTFCSIASNILNENGIRGKQYSFAEQLKIDVAPFLLEKCGIDVWTQNTDNKNDIRDFLVWYGTGFWRKRDPKHWINKVDLALKNDGGNVDVAFISDVRYPNECEWVHSWGGFTVHISTYVNEDFGKVYFKPPNEQERINDPLVKGQSDYKMEWEFKKLSFEDGIKNSYLQQEVLKALNSCFLFEDMLYLN